MQEQNNAILDSSQGLRFADIKPEEAASAVEITLKNLCDIADEVAAADANWECVMSPLAAAEEAVARVWNQIEHMHAVMNTAPWRQAYRENLEKVSQCYARLGQHKGLYAKLQEMRDNCGGLSSTQQKIIDDSLRDFKLSGVGLPDKQKDAFRQNSERLSLLSAKFSENLLDATNDYSLRAEECDLGDMPQDIKQAARQDDGSYRFTLLPPSFMAFMRYSPSREKRYDMYYYYHTRASEYGRAARDNSAIIDDIVALRARQASLLNMESYAHLALHSRMAKTPQEVLDFLRYLSQKARAVAKKELTELKQFAAEKLAINDLQPWDMAFAQDCLCRHQYNFSTAQMRPYLQVDKVLQGLFACVEKLFSARFAETPAQVWCEHARYFSLYDKNSTLIGGLYIDLYARSTKRGGAWMADALSRYKQGARLQLPIAHVVCNFTPPEKGKTALMDWEEAQTLFHEFGHALHHLLTEVDEYSASGMNLVEWDAVELPSQFMENFIWDWRILAPLSAHIDTGEPMPRALFDKASSIRHFHAGLRLMRQVEFALFDMLLHDQSPPPFMEALAAARHETAILPPPSWNRFPCGFSHIFAGGYAAGYYSYLWAEVLAADIFVLFEQSGDIINESLGMRFRREILAVGGSRPAMESFIAMRGRHPDSSALLKYYGLAA